MAILGLTPKYLFAIVPLSGFMLGAWLDRMESERMSHFRDKSALYGRQLAPGEPPSWP